MTVQLPVDETGRVRLPDDVRRRLGVLEGGSIVLENAAGGVVLRASDDPLAEAQAISRQLLAGVPGAGVDDLLRTRRSEWGE